MPLLYPAALRARHLAAVYMVLTVSATRKCPLTQVHFHVPLKSNTFWVVDPSRTPSVLQIHLSATEDVESGWRAV